MEKVYYRVCGKDYRQDSTDISSSYDISDGRVCAYSFPVSDGFILHQTALDTVSNTDLSAYKDVNGDSIITDIKNTLTQGEVMYQGKSIKDLADTFVKKYTHLATKNIAYANTDTSLPFRTSAPVSLKKLANQELYIYDRNDQQ